MGGKRQSPPQRENAGKDRGGMKRRPESANGLRVTPETDPQETDFEALYERYSREVWALAYSRWMNADIALDIMQEAFLRLWKQWQDGGEILKPRAWLLR